MGLIKAWSYSRYSTYETCPLQAKYKYIDKLPEETSDAMERGRHVHDDLAAYLRGDIPDEVAPETLVGWEHFGDLLEALRDLEPLVEQQWGYERSWLPGAWFGPEVWFRAVVDAAVVYEDHTADVVDHKTGKARPEHAQQAELYAIATMLRYPVRAVTVRFWYLDQGAESVYRFVKKDQAPLIAKWNGRVKRMLTDEIMAPKPGHHCNWCSFAKSKDGPCKYG